MYSQKAHAHRAHVRTTYISIHMAGHTYHAQTHRAFTQTCTALTASSCSLLLLSRWRSASENTHRDMYNLDPSSSWAQTLSLPSSCSWISVSPVTGTWTYESSRSQLHSSCWYRLFQSHTHTHTHTQAGFPIDPNPYSLSGNCPRLP